MTKGEFETLNGTADALILIAAHMSTYKDGKQGAKDITELANRVREIAYKYKEKDNEN